MELSSLDRLKGKKNLLAFSAGIDSTALFFLLVEHNIDFDIAIVNYNLRPQSKEELAYAHRLAKKYNKKIFYKEVHLTPPSIEKKARTIRYAFFEKIITHHGYDNLITAHQLNDQLEWFLMQLSKGAGVVELVGMDEVTQKEHYTIVRPLLYIAKKKLLAYLHQKKVRYFVDESNSDERFFRNFIRHRYSDPFIEKFEKGVRKSFFYLHEDKKLLQKKIRTIKQLLYTDNTQNEYENLRLFSTMFKKLGYLLTSSQKQEILRQREGVIGGKIAFAITSTKLFVVPYYTTPLDKRTKELYRKYKVPKVLRGYIFAHNINLDIFS